MSHIEKFGRGAAGQLGAHVDRSRGSDHVYENERIDPARSHLNYDLSGCNTPLSTIVSSAIDAAPSTVRKDAVVLMSIVHTLPTNWPADRDPREYFEACRDFDAGFLPGSFVLARATVHMDETTPHMHEVLLPLDAEGRFAFNRLVTRSMYKRYHAELAKYVRGATHLPDLRVTIPEEEQAEKQLSSLGQEAYIAAKLEIRRAEHASEQAKADLEQVQHTLAAEQARLESVRRDREAAERAAAPGGVTLGALVGDRGAATHRSELAAEKSQLRDEVADLERRVDEAERGLRGLRARVSELRGRAAVALEALRAPLAAAVQRLGLSAVERGPRGVRLAVALLGIDADQLRPRQTLDDAIAEARSAAAVQHTEQKNARRDFDGRAW